MAILDTLRNDLFLTLVKGEFEKGAKSAPKNIEVRVIIVDKHGKELQVSSFDFCFVHFAHVLILPHSASIFSVY